MKTIRQEIEELSLENARINHLYQNSLQLEMELYQENIKLKQENAIYKKGFTGQYLLAKQLMMEVQALKEKLEGIGQHENH